MHKKVGQQGFAFLNIQGACANVVGKIRKKPKIVSLKWKLYLFLKRVSSQYGRRKPQNQQIFKEVAHGVMLIVSTSVCDLFGGYRGGAIKLSKQEWDRSQG